MTELFNLKKNRLIDVSHLGLRRISDNSLVKKLFFYHIDGMYSYCLDINSKVINLKAWTMVNDLGDIETTDWNE